MSAEREDTGVAATLLARLEAGDRSAFDVLIPIVYHELRTIAHRHRIQWTGAETLGTTALVNEAYLKMAGRPDASYHGRSHFFAVASRAMRQILVDFARARKRAKRGGRSKRVSFDRVDELLAVFPQFTSEDEERILALNQSLQQLEAESERHSQVVECRFFGNMTIEETAEALDISPATVKRSWAVAKPWLARSMAAAQS